MHLPDYPPMPPETLATIARRHGVSPDAITRLPEVGIFNAIFQMADDLVLRIPRHHPAFIAAAHREAVAVHAARSAEVRTPALVAFDDSLELLPVPFSVYERVRGENLGLLGLEPAQAAGAWRDLGRDLARLHSRTKPDGPVASLEGESLPDPRPWPAALERDGYLSASEARWLSNWLDRLAPATEGAPRCFLHGDIQATNVMVTPGAHEYLALLDWGNAGWGDPAQDFAGVPLRAVPFMLEGYREISPVPGDETAEARILFKHLQIALYLARRGPQPGKSWAERPLGALLEVLRFFAAHPGGGWQELRPPE